MRTQISLECLQSTSHGKIIGGARVSIDNAWLANCNLDRSPCGERKGGGMGNEWICIRLDRGMYVCRQSITQINWVLQRKDRGMEFLLGGC